jgi:hypothetical protein
VDDAQQHSAPRTYARRQILAGLVAVPAVAWIAEPGRDPGTAAREGRVATTAPGMPVIRDSQAGLSPLPTEATHAPPRRQFGFFSDADLRTVEQIAVSGIGGISMGPYFAQPASTDSSLGQLMAPGPRLYLDAIASAHRQGLRVTLKPMVDARSYPTGGGWRAYLDPADPSAWFADYWRRAIQPYLGSIDSLIVHTELNTVSQKYPDHWRQLVSLIRAEGFTGPISSDADISITTTPWYAALDWLGGSFYPSIDLSTDQSATRDWELVGQQMSAAHTACGLPIFMAEVGVARLAEAQQIRWLETMGQVLGPMSCWAGFSYWRWSQDPRTAFTDAVQATFRALAEDCAG